jgi:hypothetical protein
MQQLGTEEQREILNEWLAQTLSTYPSGGRAFLATERDRFRNPVGYTLREQLPVILQELTGDMARERLSNAIEAIVRVRAVQDFAPSEAVAFIFRLKAIVRTTKRALGHDQTGIEDRIDQAALLAVDFYVKCRERIYELKAEDAKRRVAFLEKVYSETGPR